MRTSLVKTDPSIRNDTSPHAQMLTFSEKIRVDDELVRVTVVGWREGEIRDGRREGCGKKL